MAIAQAKPLPFSPTLAAGYRRVLKRYARNQAIAFSSLEGCIGAKITIGAFKRAGPNPTRDKIARMLNAFGEWDLGGAFVNYSPKAAPSGAASTSPSSVPAAA